MAPSERPLSEDEAGVTLDATATQEADADPHATSPVGRRVAAGAVLLGVGVAAVVGLGGVPGGTGETLLGVVGQRANVSSTAPPPGGLQLAWAREAVASDRFGYDSFAIGGVVAEDGRATLGPHVVDVATGEVVGAVDLHGESVEAARETATLEDAGRALVFVDRLTGRRTRTVDVELPAGENAGSGVVRHAAGVTLIAGWSPTSNGDDGFAVLVDDEGTVIKTFGPLSTAYRSRVQGGEPYVVLEEGRGASMETGGPGGPGTSVVLDMRTGERVLEVVHPLDRTTLDVADGLALVARAVDGRNVAGVGIAWELEAVDLVSGEVVAAFTHESGDAPTLLGRSTDGRIVVALRRGGDLVATVVGPDGLTGPQIVVSSAQRGVFSGESPTMRASAQRFAFSEDVLVVADSVAGEVRAQTLDGKALWRVSVGEVDAVTAGDGFVAIGEGSEGRTDSTQRLRLVRLLDGDQVASVATDGGDGTAVRPVVASDGVVLTTVSYPYAQRGWELGPLLQWTRVLDGAVRTTLDVVEPWVSSAPSDVASGSPSSRASTEDAEAGRETVAQRLRDLSGALRGFVPESQGPARPIVTRGLRAQSVEVLQRDGSWLTLEADDDLDAQRDPTDSGPVEPYGFYLDVADADADRLLVGVQAFEGDGDAIVLALDGRDQLRIEELYPIMLADDLVLGFRARRSDQEFGLVAVDAATGEDRWLTDASGLFFGVPLLDPNGLVFGDRFRVSAIDLEDGSSVWSWTSEDMLERTMGMSARHVFVRTSFGDVLAIDRATGEEAWRVQVGVGSAEASTVAGGHLLVGTRDGLVVHLDEDGEVVQRVRASAEPIEGLAVVDGTVVATTRSRILGLRRDGRGLVEQDQVDLP